MEKSADAYRTISEVAEELKLPQHVLRFWETRFPQVKPLKRGGNRRFYRPNDVELLRAIKTLLYGDGFTIKGVQRILKERGPRALAGMAPAGRQAAPPDRTPRAQAPPARVHLEHGEEFGGAFDTSADDEPPVDRGSDRPEGIAFDVVPHSGRSLDMESVPIDTVDRLQAVLFELSECRRILAAAGG